MSEESAVETIGAPAESSVTAEVAAPSAEASSDAAPDTTTGIFDGNDFDKEFGLTADDKLPDEPEEKDTPDVPKVAAPPAPLVTDEKEEGKTEGEKDAKAEVEEPKAEAKPADDTEEKDDQFKANEKLNWDDDKVPFREEFKNLKQAYMDLLGSSVEAQFVSDPVEFSKWMKETSPTSYYEIGTQLATESAQTHPKEWLQHFAKTHPDLMAEIASGREGMTADRLKAELEVILDEDDEDVQAALEKNKTAPTTEIAKPEETPEQKEVRQWREEREATAKAQILSDVFQPIEAAINSLVSEAGLEIKESDYQGKNFADLDEDTQFKIVVNDIVIPSAIDYFIKQDPKLVHMQSRLDGFIDKQDKTSAIKLQHPATIASTNIVGTVLSLLTGFKAKSKQSETESPTKEQPKELIKTAGASNGAAPNQDSGPIDWSGAM